MNLKQKPEVLIIGAGASGLFCAKVAASLGKKVCVLDHAPKLGLKILISGGGRCNFTHIPTTSEDFVSQNPHFCKSALAQYTAQDFLSLVQAYKIDCFEKTKGQYFCKKSSREILNLLLSECKKFHVNIEHPVKVESVIKNENKFMVNSSRGTFESPAIVLATGGLSFARLGATGLGLDIARQFGHSVVPVFPVLAGFVADERTNQWTRPLMGVTLDVSVRLKKLTFEGGLVFTHFGLSGPALLNASLYWNVGDSLTMTLLPRVDLPFELEKLKQEHPGLTLKNAFKKFFSDRLVEERLAFLKFENEILKNLSIINLKKMARAFQTFEFVPKSTSGYERAEAMRGGVNVNEVDSKTMMSRLVPGLYFIGEVLDVTGKLGGYNFQWAWSSAFVAAKNV